MISKIGVGILAVAVVGAIPAEAQSACRASDQAAEFMINGLKNLMGSSTEVVAARQRSQLPLVNPDSIVLVTSDSVCASLAGIYANAIPAADRPSGVIPSGRVYVAKVGSVYVVRDPAFVAGEWTIEMVIDPTGTVLKKLLG